eukprot:scaffold104578_cov67-Attheya_sp.AAC.3
MVNQEIQHAKKQRLKAFVTCSLEVFKYFTYFIVEQEYEGHSVTYGTDMRTFGAVILLHFVKQTEMLDNNYFDDYLKSSRGYIMQLICHNLHPKTCAHDRELDCVRIVDMEQDDAEILQKVQAKVSEFFTEVTNKLLVRTLAIQKHQESLHKLEAYVEKDPNEKCTEATQTALELEPRATPKMVGQLVEANKGTPTKPSNAKPQSPGQGKRNRSVNPKGKNVVAAPQAQNEKKRKAHQLSSDQAESNSRPRKTSKGEIASNGNRHGNPDERPRGGNRGRKKGKTSKTNKT